MEYEEEHEEGEEELVGIPTPYDHHHRLPNNSTSPMSMPAPPPPPSLARTSSINAGRKPAAGVRYRECLKNHAAAIGGHALDGCGEFMPSPHATASEPTSLRCAACGCHRNFHRRHDDSGGGDDFATPTGTSPPPPPPISAAQFPSAPHMLLALSTGAAHSAAAAPAARKRFRSKFSREQKERMLLFAQKLGWRMLKQDEKVVEEFCGEVGVTKGVLKVWMHNNKHTFVKKAEGGQPLLASGSSNQLNNGVVHEFDSNNGRTNGTTPPLFNGSSSSS